jgi:hypothetical protein
MLGESDKRAKDKSALTSQHQSKRGIGQQR